VYALRFFIAMPSLSPSANLRLEVRLSSPPMRIDPFFLQCLFVSSLPSL